MNQPGCIVCSSSSPLPLFKIYTRFENRGINFKYIHPVCLLFFDNSDWIYDNEYVTKNVDLVEYKHNQAIMCILCKDITQDQQQIKCFDISCNNYFHIGCSLNYQTTVFYNKQHNHTNARFIVFCHQHYPMGTEKERRGHIYRIDKRTIEQQTQRILGEHIQHKQKYVVQQPKKQSYEHSLEKKRRHHKHKKHHYHRDRDRDRDRDRSRHKHKYKSRRYSRSRSYSRRHRSRSSSRIQARFSSSSNIKDEGIKELITKDEFIVKQLFEQENDRKVVVKKEEDSSENSQIYIRKKGQQLKEMKEMQQMKEMKKMKEMKEQQIVTQVASVLAEQSQVNQQNQTISIKSPEYESNILEQLLQGSTKIEEEHTYNNSYNTYKKKRLINLNQKDAFEMIRIVDNMYPVFPSHEPDSRRDNYIAAWWKCVSILYFPESESIKGDLLQEQNNEEYVRGLKWYYNSNASMQDNNEYGIGFNYQLYLEPLILIKYLMKNTINVLYSHHQFQDLIFIRYNYQPQSLSLQEDDIQVQVPSWDLQIYQHDQLLDYEKQVNMDNELLFVEYIALAQQEYQYLQKLDSRIDNVQKELENHETFEEMFSIEELDIAYHILIEDLQSIIEQNNKTKQKLYDQLINETYNQQQLIDDMDLQMDLLKWTTVLQLVKLGYSDKNSEILNTYYRVHLSQDSAKTSWKGLTKMQNLLSKSNDKPLDTDCKICFDGTITDGNPIVYCDKQIITKTAFHKLCYGIPGLLLDQQEILCDSCQSLDKSKKRIILDNKPTQCINCKKAVCYICRKLGFPQRFIKGRFFHVACLILTNSIIFEKGQIVFRAGVNLKSIANMREESETYLDQCAICGVYKGYRIQCCTQQSAIPCRQSFHPICAYLHGLKINIESGDLEEDSKQGIFSKIEIKILCINHMDMNTEQIINQIYYRRFGLNFEQTAKMGGFDKFEVEFRGSLGYSYIISKLPNQKKNQEQMIRKKKKSKKGYDDDSDNVISMNNSNISSV